MKPFTTKFRIRPALFHVIMVDMMLLQFNASSVLEAKTYLTYSNLPEMGGKDVGNQFCLKMFYRVPIPGF